MNMVLSQIVLKVSGDLNNDSTLANIRSNLKRFDYLAGITTLHFMMDLGLNVMKPGTG